MKSIDNEDFALNVEDESNVVLKGAKIKIDSNETFSEQVTSSEQNKSESKYVYYTVSYVYHTVSRDENLFRISVNYNVSVERLWMLNNLSSTIVKVGTVLKVKSL